MPTLPTNPDSALNDNALDDLVKAKVNSNHWVDDFDLRNAIHWTILQYYGLDEKYDFNSSADAMNASKWSVWSMFGSVEGSNDLDRFTRIWQQYLARYAGDPEPVIAFKVAETKTPVEAGVEAAKKELIVQTGKVFEGVKGVGDVVMFLIENLKWVIIGTAVIYLFIQMSKTETGSDIIKRKLEKMANV